MSAFVVEVTPNHGPAGGLMTVIVVQGDGTRLPGRWSAEFCSTGGGLTRLLGGPRRQGAESWGETEEEGDDDVDGGEDDQGVAQSDPLEEEAVDQHAKRASG